jgi:OOP family OmpA-OmpF porin
VGLSAGAANVEAEIDLVALDDTDLGFKLFGGYRFTDHFGVELGYADFGEQSARDGEAQLTTEIAGWTAEAVGLAPVGERFEVFGKLGLIFAETDFFSSGGFEPRGVSDRTAELAAGLGGAVRLGRLAVRVELEYFANDSVDRILLLSAGLEFRF